MKRVSGATGIGATSAIFAVVNGVLLQSLPYRDDARLVNLWSHNTSEARPRHPLSPANFLDFQRTNTTLDGLEGYFTFITPAQLQTDSGTEIAYSFFVTSNMFNMLGRTAALGRTFTVGEESGVVVLSDGYWRRRFGGDPTIVGQVLSVSGQSLEVLGVMPPDFVFPYSGMLGPSGFTRVTGVDMWLPIGFSGPMAVNNRMLNQSGQIVRNVHWFGAIGRLKAGVSEPQAAADARTIASQLEQSYPETNMGWSATVVSSIDQSVGTIRPALMILLAGIGFVLVMASVNVANLLLARSIAREKELATRAALGAGRARIARQLLTESILFALAGGLVGMVVMWWTVRGLTASPERLAFYRDFFARMESLPGVVAVGGTTRVPLGSTSVTTTVQIDGRPVPNAELPEVQFRRAMHNYFETMGIPVRRGRNFDPKDGATAPSVAVINETMAKRLFPGQDAVGQRIRTGPGTTGPWTTIVGVIGDIRHGGLEQEPQPEMYISYLQGPPVSPFIVLRTAGDPAALAETVRAEARLIDKNLPLYDMRTMSTLRSEAVSTRRFILLIVGAFGTLALGLAAIGVYGVMSLIVSERTREVGVRLALGARPSELLGMIVGQAAKLAGVGVVLGLAVSLPLAPLLDSQLYGIESFDPLTLVVVPAALLLIATLAALVPARRAMRIDPLAALRID